jgi:uncharacterized cofD-like protein
LKFWKLYYMNNFESRPESDRTYTIGFGGGGSNGKTIAEFLDAIDINPSISADVEAFGFVGTLDDGSSTGRLRELFGTPAVGDIRRSISAVSANQDAASDFERRFVRSDDAATVRLHADQLLATLSYTQNRLSSEQSSEIMDSTVQLAKELVEKEDMLIQDNKLEEKDRKGLQSIALGHLVLTALVLSEGIDGASHTAGELLQVRAEIIPVSTESHLLTMRDGHELVVGEHKIDERVIQNPDNVQVWVSDSDGTPVENPLNPRLAQFINRADKIVIGPGSVYTSMAPSVMAGGMKDVLADKQLTIVGNLVTQPTETSGWTGRRYVETTEEYVGRKFDEVIYNEDTAELPNAVVYDRNSLEEAGNYRIIAANMVKGGEIIRDPEDPLASKRSEFEHDMSAVAELLIASEELRHTADLIDS